MNYGKPVWITWENQRRSVVLSKEFDCELFLYERSCKSKILRYLLSSGKTLFFIFKRKPNIVFCQNPSLVLTALLCVSQIVFNYKLVVDRHSNFMFNMPKTIIYKIFQIISNYTIKMADLIIVSNDYLKKYYIENVGGNGAVLPDKIPDMSVDNNIDTKNKKSVFFITSFSRDEPCEEFFEAIDDLPEDYYFYVSGNYKKLKYEIAKQGKNYELTGFVEEDRFKAILKSVDAVMVFTKHEYTLTCGAYEGIAANKPLILSNTKTIKEYFNKGSIYCDMSVDAIRSGILECFEKYDYLKWEIFKLKKELNISWKKQFNEIKEIVFS